MEEYAERGAAFNPRRGGGALMDWGKKMAQQQVSDPNSVLRKHVVPKVQEFATNEFNKRMKGGKMLRTGGAKMPGQYKRKWSERSQVRFHIMAELKRNGVPFGQLAAKTKEIMAKHDAASSK